MAPTTLVNQVTTTTPYGRNPDIAGYPVHVCEMLATLDGTTYAERVAVNNPKNVLAAKRAIKKAFQTQINGKGFSIVEVVSSCPTYWGMSPREALDWMEDGMFKTFPLGIYADKTKGESND